MASGSGAVVAQRQRQCARGAAAERAAACALPVHRDVLRTCMCTACACAHVPLPLHVQVRQHERDRQSRDQREREAELSTPLQQQAVVKAQASGSRVGR